MKELNGIPSMEMTKVRNIFCKLSELAGTGWNIPESEDYISITEWANGDGCSIDIGGKKYFDLSYYELDAIRYLIDKMMYEFKR